MIDHQYSGTERREDNRRVDVNVDDLTALMTRIVTLIEKYMEAHDNMLSAFPDGDLAGHKAAHEAWIAKTKAQTDFWLDMRNTLAKWGLIGLAGWVFVQLWQSALKGPQ